MPTLELQSRNYKTIDQHFIFQTETLVFHNSCPESRRFRALELVLSANSQTVIQLARLRVHAQDSMIVIICQGGIGTLLNMGNGIGAMGGLCVYSVDGLQSAWTNHRKSMSGVF